MDLKKMSFVMACSSHFGRKPGQTLQEFNRELKELTPKDREDLTTMFRDLGIDATMGSGVSA